jgi:GT2 family glycosyltransferase
MKAAHATAASTQGPVDAAPPGPTLAAIVPATDRPRTLGRCVEAIRAASEAPDEIIVIDEPAGAGPAAARNAGVARTRAELVAFVDSDVVVRPDTFVRIRRAFAADPGLCAVFGSYDDAPEAPGAVSGFRNLLHHHVHQADAGRIRTFWAGLGGVRRDAFLAAGGFDERRYPEPSVEDIELGMRLADAGGRIELAPGLQGKHLKAWTLAEATRTDFARRGAPWSRLIWERGWAGDELNLGWRHRASAVASVIGLAALAARRPAPTAAAALTLLALNRSFYGLLLRRRGPVEAAAGVGLHALHHAVGAVSVPVGILSPRYGRPAAGTPASREL